MKVDFGELRRVVVAVDPAGGHDETSDDTGIVVVARGPHQDETCRIFDLTGRCPGHGYVLADLTCHLAPHGWAARAVKAYDKFRADKIIAEKNYGGEMVEATIHAIRIGVPLQIVNASRGKTKRAQPIATLWEQGRCHFVADCPELEDELTTWTEDAGWSPNRLDALVWGMTALGLIGGQGDAFMAVWRGEARDRKVVSLVDRQEERTKRELERISRSAPKRYGRRDRDFEIEQGVSAAQRRCEHRFRGEVCLFCGVTRSQIIQLPKLKEHKYGGKRSVDQSGGAL